MLLQRPGRHVLIPNMFLFLEREISKDNTFTHKRAKIKHLKQSWMGAVNDALLSFVVLTCVLCVLGFSQCNENCYFCFLVVLFYPLPCGGPFGKPL